MSLISHSQQLRLLQRVWTRTLTHHWIFSKYLVTQMFNGYYLNLDFTFRFRLNMEHLDMFSMFTYFCVII